ncbi:MAG TPA: response regulator [Anaerolineaceae bacterium]|nr:response regulator [Anaerolineaceae bacterium]HPN52098.1 response regulator [Anaerolineaceae bacterium]
MANEKDRILVVESDPIISDLIARQALQAMGYQVQVVGDATAAIPQTLQFAPDVIIVDINLPGLSGKDMMVALSSQGLNTPVVIVARKGLEADVIQAFRLGATDYLLWPMREAEVISAVERVLRQVRERREKDRLAQQLQSTNLELQNRVRELTTIFAIGKAVTSVTDQRSLFDKIVEGALKVTLSDMGWFMLLDETQKTFILVSQRNLPSSVASHMDQPWDDGISSLVAMSGEPLLIDGEPLKRFKIAVMGQSAVIVPVKVQKKVVALISMMRKTARPYGPSEQHLLEAISDYVGISLVNSRLFRALEERARSLQQSADAANTLQRIKNELLRQASEEMRQPLTYASAAIDRALQVRLTGFDPDERQSFVAVQTQFDSIMRIADAMSGLSQMPQFKKPGLADLNEVAGFTVRQMQPFAQKNGVALVTELSSDPVLALADGVQMVHVADGLVSNAIKYSPSGRQVTVRVDYLENQPHLMVKDNGTGIEARHIPKLFEKGYMVEKPPIYRFGGLGINLNLLRDIVTANKGRVWVESQYGRGTTFHVLLPPAR